MENKQLRNLPVDAGAAVVVAVVVVAGGDVVEISFTKTPNISTAKTTSLNAKVPILIVCVCAQLVLNQCLI